MSSISGISSSFNYSVGTNSSSEINQLEKQITNLKKQLENVSKGNDNAMTKAQKTKQIQTQIEQLQTRIKQIQSKNNNQNISKKIPDKLKIDIKDESLGQNIDEII